MQKPHVQKGADADEFSWPKPFKNSKKITGNEQTVLENEEIA